MLRNLITLHPTEAPAASAAAASGKPLKIGLITDQSKALQLYGQQEINGFKLGLQYATEGTNTVAGRPIELIVKDDEGNADKARPLRGAQSSRATAASSSPTTC